MGEDIDVVIRTGTLKDSGLAARRLAAVALKLVAAPSYLQANGTPEIPADLARHKLLDCGASKIEWRMHKGAEVETVHGDMLFSANDTGTVRTVVLSGAGIGCLPDYLCRADLESGALVHVLPQWSRGNHDIHAVFPQHRTVSPKVRSFIDFVCQRIERTTAFGYPRLPTDLPLRVAPARVRSVAKAHGRHDCPAIPLP